MDGVLASWAVPKGPTLDPAMRRMAVHVEDHPLEYFDFEGVIPARQYGAGDVIVWDWGTWEPEEETPDPVPAVHDGEVKFRLRGEKLSGRYTLVRTGRSDRRRGEEGEGDPWLLIKKRDEAASAGWDAENHPFSVKTGRTNDDVKANRDAVWVSRAPAAEAEIDLAAAKTQPMPEFVPPMLATLSDRAFTDPDWLFEIKWDGYRIEAVVRDGAVRLWTRNGNDGETYFGDFLSPPSWIDAETAIVDGEVVAIGPDGLPDFSLLQQRGGRRTRGGTDAPLVYQAFDLLYLDGRSLLEVPLEDRKRLLRTVLREQDRVRFASHVVAEGQAFYDAAAAKDLEGIIAKHRHSRYEAGRRSSAWLKIKVRPEQELVVGGYLPGEGTHKELGALIVGVHEDGKLAYAGRVGSGIDTHTRADLRDELDRLIIDRSPFDPAPEQKGDLREARWVEPRLVIRAEFSNWTRDNLVRQAAFKGLEREKDPRTVIRERPRPASEAKREAEEEAEEAQEMAERAKADESTGEPKPAAARRRARRKPTAAAARPPKTPPKAEPPTTRRRRRSRASRRRSETRPSPGSRRRRDRARRPRSRRRPSPDEPAAGRHARRDRRARGTAERGPLGGRRRDPQAHQPQQAALPAAPRRPEGRARHQARADPLLRPDRAGHAAPSRGPGPQPPPLPQRHAPGRGSGRRTSRSRRPSGSTCGTRPASTIARRTTT